MKHRQPITPEKVYQSLEAITEDHARDNSGSILRPFENTIRIPATSQTVNNDDLYFLEQEEGFYRNMDTLKGSERRMHVLGTVTTRTFVVPEHLPNKPEDLMPIMLGNEMAKIAVARVSITSMHPIWIKAEHAVRVLVPVGVDTPAREVAAKGVAGFLNGGEGLLDVDSAKAFKERLKATRIMAREDQIQMRDAMDDFRKKLRRR